MIELLRAGDRVEWSRLDDTVEYGTLISPTIGSFDFVDVAADSEGARVLCVKHYLLRLATPPGVRDLVAQAIHAGCTRSGDLNHGWRWDLDRVDLALTALIRAGHLAQPQCPVTTISISGKEPPP